METKKTSPLFWMATRLIVAYTVLTLLGLGWAWLVRSLPQAILFLALWLLSFALYKEWKYGG